MSMTFWVLSRTLDNGHGYELRLSGSVMSAGGWTQGARRLGDVSTGYRRSGTCGTRNGAGKRLCERPTRRRRLDVHLARGCNLRRHRHARRHGPWQQSPGRRSVAALDHSRPRHVGGVCDRGADPEAGICAAGFFTLCFRSSSRPSVSSWVQDRAHCHSVCGYNRARTTRPCRRTKRRAYW